MTGATNATTAQRLTPKSPGAIGVIAVQGPSATAWVLEHFQTSSGKKLIHWPLNTPRFGRWNLDTQHSEEIIVVRQQTDRFELQCHAGLVVQAILTQLEKLGATLTDPGSEVSCRHPQSLEEQATNALLRATTTTAAAILLDQQRGALRRELEAIAQHLQNHALSLAETKIQALRQHATLGMHLTDPWRVQLAGPPNVGKSSLLNRILGYQRVIVHDSAGTTRDLVHADTSISGWPFRFFDSAGIRENIDLAEAEAMGIERALTAAQSMDLILLILEPTHGMTETHQKFIRQFPHKTLLILNQIDRTSDGDGTNLCKLWGALGVSARAGTGIPSLFTVLSQRLIPSLPNPNSPVPFKAQHFDALSQALSALQKEDLSAATALLHELLAPSAS